MVKARNNILKAVAKALTWVGAAMRDPVAVDESLYDAAYVDINGVLLCENVNLRFRAEPAPIHHTDAGGPLAFRAWCEDAVPKSGFEVDLYKVMRNRKPVKARIRFGGSRKAIMTTVSVENVEYDFGVGRTARVRYELVGTVDVAREDSAS